MEGDHAMTRFDGNAARQLDLIDPTDLPRPVTSRPTRPALRLLKEDVYAEILKRRRRAQIAARHAIAKSED
jgi:hypothetical protein